MKKIWKWFSRIALILLGLFILIAICGAIFHSRRTAATNRKYLPPGQLVKVNGLEVHFLVKGEGSPVVIIEAGGGEASYDYLHIMPEVAEFATVFCYDRFGLGWSEPTTDPRDSLHVVEELRLLLKEVNLPPPYILCGHSFGGQTVRLYASLYPEEVSGLVLIDALNTDVLPDDFSREMPLSYDLLCLAARCGAAELLLPRGYPRIRGEPKLNELRIAMKCRTNWWITSRRELFTQSDWRKVRASMTHLGKTPVTVVSTPGKDLEDFMGVTWWPEAQEALLSISDDIEQIEVTECGHWIHCGKPDVVVEAIRRVVQRVKAAPETSEH